MRYRKSIQWKLRRELSYRWNKLLFMIKTMEIKKKVLKRCCLMRKLSGWGTASSSFSRICIRWRMWRFSRSIGSFAKGCLFRCGRCLYLKKLFRKLMMGLTTLLLIGCCLDGKYRNLKSGVLLARHFLHHLCVAKSSRNLLLLCKKANNSNHKLVGISLSQHRESSK